jgi:hypothetical protein
VANRHEVAASGPAVGSWLSLTVIAGGGGRRRTIANSNGRLRTTTDGFEDRVSDTRQCAAMSAQDEASKARIR